MKLDETTNMYVVAAMTMLTLTMALILGQNDVTVTGFGFAKVVYTTVQQNEALGLAYLLAIGYNAVYNPPIAISLITFYSVLAALPNPRVLLQQQQQQQQQKA